MALNRCKECGNEMSSNAVACPKCGWRPARTRWWIVVPALAATAFLAFGAFVVNDPAADQRVDDRRRIAQCWADYERKSLDPSEKRFVASVCEKLERDFVTKHRMQP